MGAGVGMGAGAGMGAGVGSGADSEAGLVSGREVTSGERKGSFCGLEETALPATEFWLALTRGNSQSSVFLVPILQEQSMKSTPVPAIASLNFSFMAKKRRKAAQNHRSNAT